MKDGLVNKLDLVTLYNPILPMELAKAAYKGHLYIYDNLPSMDGLIKKLPEFEELALTEKHKYYWCGVFAKEYLDSLEREDLDHEC